MLSMTLEPALAFADVVEGDVAFLGILIDEDGVALGERPAAAVLPRKPDVVPFLEQGAEGERLRGGPVDTLARPEPLLLGLELPPDGRVQRDTVGHGRQRPADLAQPPLAYRRSPAPDLAVGPTDALPPPFEPHRAVGPVTRRGLELPVEMVAEPVGEAVDLSPCHLPLVDELARVDLPRRRVFGDLPYMRGCVNLGSSPSLWPRRR